MKKNPIIPFLLIMVLGFGVVFFLSIQGLSDSEEIAEEEAAEEGGGGEGEEASSEEFDPEALYQQACVGCHGSAYEGGAGPALTGVGGRLGVDEIKGILQNGKGAMPAGLVPEENLDAMAEWVAAIEE